jgi:competence protein ComFA
MKNRIEHISRWMMGRCLLEEEATRWIRSVLAEEGIGMEEQEIVRSLEEAEQAGWISSSPAVDWVKGARSRLRCNRCGQASSLKVANCQRCDGACAMCEACLVMGRSRSCGRLWIGATTSQWKELGEAGGPGSGPGPGSGTEPGPGISFEGWSTGWKRYWAERKLRKRRRHWEELAPLWKGAGQENQYPWRFSDAQWDAVQAMMGFLEEPGEERFLIWAVCGAGKTEILFPAIQWAAEQHTPRRRVLIATPRRDVVMELAPRLAKAFPQLEWAVLHGESQSPWIEADFVLATTHQTLRFYHAFDLVIVDEADAFPFQGDPMLEYAIQRALKPGGKRINLTATPTPFMQQEVRSGHVACARIPLRFHGYPLPEPKLMYLPSLGSGAWKAAMRQKIHSMVGQSLDRGAQLFVFVPSIRDVERVRASLDSLQMVEPERLSGTHSQDPDRSRKVQAFRDGYIRILVTTTILERGITVPKTDVIVWQADSSTFTAESLIQMSGRVGRSVADPVGNVTFVCQAKARPPLLAIREIQTMNQLAKKRGSLKGENG